LHGVSSQRERPAAGNDSILKQFTTYV